MRVSALCSLEGAFMQGEDIQVALTARAVAYRTLSALFDEDSPEIIDIAANGTFLDAIQILASFGATTLDECAGELQLVLDEVCKMGPVAFANMISGDFAKLFVGPDKLLAPPWESVYRTHERVLFGKCTLDVRRAYRDAGYIPEGYPHVADDHIALELGFMGLLAERSLAASRINASADFREGLRKQHDFLSEHLALWIDGFSGMVGAAPVCRFYKVLALTVNRLVRCDGEIIEKLLQGSVGCREELISDSR